MASTRVAPPAAAPFTSCTAPSRLTRVTNCTWPPSSPRLKRNVRCRSLQPEMSFAAIQGEKDVTKGGPSKLPLVVQIRQRNRRRSKLIQTLKVGSAMCTSVPTLRYGSTAVETLNVATKVTPRIFFLLLWQQRGWRFSVHVYRVRKHATLEV